jgi:glutathione S-transferase
VFETCRTGVRVQVDVDPVGLPVEVIADGMKTAEKSLDVIEGLMGGDLLCGSAVTLADLHLLPVVEYLRMTKPGAAAFAARPRLAAWWERMNARETVVRTRPKLG